MKNFAFIPSAVQHIYQRSLDKGVIFYTLEDRLVYYTLAAVNAKRRGVTVCAASIMFTHIHQSLRSRTLYDLRMYLHDTNSSFSRLYNAHYSRKGPLFDKAPGRSQKKSSKEMRSNLVYVFNNHVEKRVCKSAVQERWSFVAYSLSDHPFSDKINPRKSSKPLKKALRLVDRRIRKMKGLEYSDLDRIFGSIEDKEREQFIDYVISHYAWIDFSEGISLFGSRESMILTLDSTVGGEYEINEYYTKHPDTPYIELIALAERNGFIDGVHSMPESEKADLIILASQATSASVHHLESFFHVKIKGF